MTHTRSSAPARLVLAATLTALTLSACGQSDGDGATDRASDRASEPTAGTSTSEPVTPAPDDSASATGGEGATTGGGAVLVAGDTPSTTTARIISASNADGEVDVRPVSVADPESLDEFVATLGADLGPRVRAAVRRVEVPAGETLMAAVVAVGCDRPTGVELVQTFDGYEVTGIVPKSGVQCLVTMTSVALFTVVG
jgi:hypothetical protein